MRAVRRRESRSQVLLALKSWLQDPNPPPLRLDGRHAADVADVLLLDFESEDARRLVRALPDEEAAAVLEETELKFIASLLEGADPQWVGRLVSRLPSDAATDLTSQLPEALRSEVMCFVNPEEAAEIRHLAAYPPDTAGGMMTTEFLTARSDENVGDVLRRIKRDEGAAETVYTVFVTDQKDALLGVVSTRELLEAGIHQEVREILNPDVIQVKVDEDREEVARRLLHYNLTNLPVVDLRGVLIGIVTSDDALEVIEKEGSEDALLLAGAGGASDLTDSTWTKVLRRAPMLAVPIFAGLLISKVVHLVTGHTLGAAAADGSGEWSVLLSYLPLVLAMAGTVGMQTSAVLVRGFAVGQIVVGRRAEVMFSEVQVGLLLGVFAAAVAGPAMAFLVSDFKVGTAMALALFLAVSWSAAAAAGIALGSEAVGLDPALVSGPVMMGVSDLSAAALFLGVSSLLVL
jgi:magnesium transporter